MKKSLPLVTTRTEPKITKPMTSSATTCIGNADDALDAQNMGADRLDQAELRAPEKARHVAGEKRVGPEEQRREQQDRPARAPHAFEDQQDQDRRRDVGAERRVVFPALLQDVEAMRAQVAVVTSARAASRRFSQVIRPRSRAANGR